MKVVALVSGGKDSCYAMMECVRYGHEIAVLAHLHPPLELSPEDAEIDSFMYQSVGHNVVGMIAESMELPLVTETITGTAVTQDIDYRTATDGDEVEDLYRLLANVVRQYPDVTGVCTGAIFSSYQRNRVENVCSRLGLTSLGYLWRREQAELLDDMIESGIEAILVKVASIGLTPRKHLGKTIAELQMGFLALQDKYQLNVCGEGGEYETLTLDCPLFKKRIVIDSSRVVLHSDDCFAPVAFLVIEQCHLEAKEPASPSKLASRLPPALDLEQLDLNAASSDDDSVDNSGARSHTVSALAQLSPAERAFLPSHSQFRAVCHLSGVMSAHSVSLSLDDEIADVFELVQAALREAGMTLEDICFVHLYVRDMNTFAAVNAAYCRYFGQYMPPSRSCVEVASLPARVLLDCLGVRGSGASKLLKTRVARDVLHIKSVSAWAPNCIGPYSQANILHRALILLAGQVAFLPQTMAIVGADHTAQAHQCFRNAGRVLEALDSNLRHVCSAVVYATRVTHGGERLAQLAELGRAQLIANGGLQDHFEDVVDSDESDDELDKDAERVKFVVHAPILVVQVSHLPRHALVEVELQAFCHRVLKHLSPVSSVLTRSDANGDIAWAYECQRSIVSRALCLVVCTAARSLKAASASHRLDTVAVQHVARGLLACIEQSFATAQLPWDRAVHFRVFYRVAAFENELAIATAFRAALATSYKQSEAATLLPAMTFVPTHALQSGADVAVQVTAHDLDKFETELWLRKQV